VLCSPSQTNPWLRGKRSLRQNPRKRSLNIALCQSQIRDIVHIENGVWTLTLNASRRILLTEKHSDAPASRGRPRPNRLKWIEARSCKLSKVGKRRASKIIKVIAKMPLHSGKDRMALILLTLKHLENLKTDDAIAKYEVRLVGGTVRQFSERQEASREQETAAGQGPVLRGVGAL
jgi:hypothetical protein